VKIRCWFQTRWVCDLESTPDGQILKSGPEPHGCDMQLLFYGQRASGEALLRLLTQRMRTGMWTAQELREEPMPPGT